MRTTIIKGATTRSGDDLSTGFLKFMRDTVHPADHGPEGIQGAKAVIIQRAHQPHRHLFFICFCSFPADLFGLKKYIALFSRVLFFKARAKIIIFQIGMMIEAGQTAIIRTPVTLKLIVPGRPAIFLIYGGKNIAQAIKESGQKAIINMNWIRL